jgi:hydrogenase maturation protease
MNFDSVSRIAETLLFEGYLLYPYRPSSVKNQKRWTFGCLLPPAFPYPAGSAERSFLQTECLVFGNARTELEVKARFLHLSGHAAMRRDVDTPTVTLDQLIRQRQVYPFAFPHAQHPDGIEVRSLAGRISNPSHTQAIKGTLTLSAQRCNDAAFKLCVQLHNETPLNVVGRPTRDDVLAWSLLSSHLLLGVHDGEFMSLLDPPEELQDYAASCRQVGVWPVLAGEETRRDIMLAGPIILEDFPRTASASSGDFFDGTEIDEILTLRIRTLTDKEKHEMASSDPRAEELLQRCESLTNEQLLGLHDAWRGEEKKLSRVRVGNVVLEPGMRVRLRPQGRADAFDLALSGMTAVIVSIEQDFEAQLYVSVALDEDPGRDLGITGKPAHRFFFRPEEVEPLQEDVATQSVLIAGIGNIFFGDDAFGIEVVRRLAQKVMTAGVAVKDFGIRGFDLACALQDGYHTAILVDTIQRGGPPGTLHVLKLDPDANESTSRLEMHRLDPMQVFRLVRRMGGQLPHLFLVGCEPASLEPAAELSEPVRHAAAEAVAVIESLIAERSFQHDKT